MLHNSQLVTFPAHSAPPELPSWGSESEHSELQTIVASLRSNQTKSAQAEEAFPPRVQAATRVHIPAYTSTQVRVPGPFNREGDWIVKHLMVTMPDALALSAPSTFIRTDKSGVARILAANFSPHLRFIQPGEVLGLARNPHLWLDEFSPGAKDSAEKVAAFLGKQVQGTMREEESPAEQDRENELLGPKAAEVPELETLPSSDLASFLDISSEVPPETQSWIKELIKSYKDAFGFDDQLGNMLIEVQIDTILGAHPISSPLHGTSSQKSGAVDT